MTEEEFINLNGKDISWATTRYSNPKTERRLCIYLDHGPHGKKSWHDWKGRLQRLYENVNWEEL